MNFEHPLAYLLGPWPRWPWSLGALAPVAAWAANVDTPIAVVWSFRLDQAAGPRV